MREKCLPCTRWQHEKCDGLDHVVDMDGFSAYQCGCYCNIRTVSETCRHCGGLGQIRRMEYTKNRGRPATAKVP